MVYLMRAIHRTPSEIYDAVFATLRLLKAKVFLQKSSIKDIEHGLKYTTADLLYSPAYFLYFVYLCYILTQPA